MPRDSSDEADKKTGQRVMDEIMGQKLATLLQASRETITHDFKH